MFYPHRAIILIRRAEPATQDHRQLGERARRRNALVAERLVLKDLLRPRPVNVQAERKLARKYEVLARREDVQEFMQVWNHWRQFYFGLDPVQPKTGGQLTQIERFLTSEPDVNRRRMIVATTHKAFVWRNVNPGFGDLLVNGEDNLKRYRGEVVADVDRVAYARGALVR